MGYLDEIPTTLTEYITEVRGTIRDDEALNHILLERDDGKEYSDNDIKRYIYRALGRINAKPPISQYEMRNFPHKQQWLLIVDGAIIEAMKSAGILKIRNEMNYQDQGGVSVRLEGKGSQYIQTAMSLYQGWREMLLEFKQGISVDEAWGGVKTEFSYNWW